jgi:methylmalonyl-CoA mutase N-terminal domain/subunit
VVGVNRFPAATEPLVVFAIDPATEAAQARSVVAIRAQRDQAAVDSALGALRDAASSGEKVLPATIEAVQAYATIGEVVDVLRSVFGAWKPTAAF